eukprot:SAG22_NODE_1197_length_5195_cov_2.344388_3_plen_307_part_00
MQNAGFVERLLLFGFINSFACTDSNLTTAPTSRGALVLAFWRIVEAALVSLLLVPQFGEGLDNDGDGVIDTISAFQVKAYMAVFLSLGSFSCLLAATTAEQMLAREVRLGKRRKAQRSTAPDEGADRGCGSVSICRAVGRLGSWLSNNGFLFVLLLLSLLVLVFTAQILYSVYLLGGAGARRCRCGSKKGSRQTPITQSIIIIIVSHALRTTILLTRAPLTHKLLVDDGGAGRWSYSRCSPSPSSCWCWFGTLGTSGFSGTSTATCARRLALPSPCSRPSSVGRGCSACEMVSIWWTTSVAILSRC